MKPVIIGTAGHIDHGKTALVKALTGTNTDRLKEEQERGITIELGYAFLDERIAIIDVPGHERFIKNMVAGVATVDFAMLVVAADDGIMPQTREHFDILRLLGVEDGIVVVTKCGLAEPDWVDLVVEEIREMAGGSFLEGRPILRADSLSGDGIEDVRRALVALADRKKERVPGPVFRLPIDRVFTIKGFGTVVTGSALSGQVNVEDRLELLPRGDLVRVRAVETQGKHVAAASAGMRVALNIPQVAVDDVARGDVLATPDRLKPTFMLDVECRVLEGSPVALEQRQRVRVHLGTKELMARVIILDRDRIQPGEQALVQLRLEERTAAQRLDRYVIRRYSPPVTIGGGRILDANPAKHRQRHLDGVVGALTGLGDASVEKVVARILSKERVVSFDDLVTKSSLSPEQVEGVTAALGIDGGVIEIEAKGARYLAADSAYEAFLGALEADLAEYHAKNPLKVGAKRGEISKRASADLPEFAAKRFLELAIGGLRVRAPSGDLLALYAFEVNLTKRQRAALERMEKALLDGRFQPPDLAALCEECCLDEKQARQLLQMLVDDGRAVGLEGKIYFHARIIAEGVELLRRAFAAHPEMTMSDFRTTVDTSRKYSVPLLNYYDNQGLSTRRGDVRVPGPKLAPAP
jgi:selenocysteine-specific elongation factor